MQDEVVCHRTSTLHKNGNKMKRKKKRAIIKRDISVQNCLMCVIINLVSHHHFLCLNSSRLSHLTGTTQQISDGLLKNCKTKMSHLASLLHLSNIPRQLRSSTSRSRSVQLSVSKTKLNLGKRAFSVAVSYPL